MKLNIESGIKKRAIKCIIMGCEGIGKSTLAAKFPEPLFIDTENGTSSLNVRRIICNKSWTDLIEMVNPNFSSTSTSDVFPSSKR